MRARTSPGTPCSRGGAEPTTLPMTCAGVLPSNAGLPRSISWPTQPSDQTSAAAVSVETSPRACSGLM